MKENVKDCQRCGKVLILEEFANHNCSPYIEGVREIIVDYSFDVINGNGDKVVIAKGLDNGVVYRLIECKHNPTHRSGPRLNYATRRVLTRRKNDKDLPEPTSITRI